jgi:O-antigen/teichoic acid export membrane protein
VTGPLLARSLGATGRGQLASIIVPATLLTYLAGLGVESWVTVESARGRALGTVLGTAGTLSVGFGLIGACAALPVAVALAGGNATVFLFIAIAGAMLPLSLVIQLLSCAAIGCSRWRMQAQSRVVPTIVGLVLTVGLYVSRTLTLTTAAIVFLVTGVLSIVPLLPLLREARPFRFERALARSALGFGCRAWASNLGALANARLDQLMMIPLVPSRQLGLYAVAVTYSNLPSVLSSSMMTVIGPRIAAGDNALVGRSVRVTIGIMTGAGACFALLAPVVIPLGFGHDFGQAVEMAWILLVAGVPLAATVVLSGALICAGRPGVAAIGQLIAAGVTAVGLVVALPTLQAVGAALVSLMAYTTALAYMLWATRRHFETTIRSLLTPATSDIEWAVSILRGVRDRVSAKRGRSPMP